MTTSVQHDSGPSDAGLDHRSSHPELKQFAGEKHLARPPSSQRSLAHSVALVATCTLAMVVNTSNMTSVSMALPDIGRSIDIQEGQLQWLLSAYSLSSGCLLLFFGRLADLYGRKKGFMLGMFWQMVFAIGIGFSSSGIVLDVLRGFQGMGAAASIPSALGILAHAFPSSRARSIAFATFAAGAPVGGAFGNIIGGVLTQLSLPHWRSTFFVTAGLCALCILGCLASFNPDEISSEADPRVDWIGAILVTSGLVLIVFVLGQGEIAGWGTPYIIVCLILGVILTGLFVLWEYHLEKTVTSLSNPKSFWTPPPLMRLSLWGRAHGRMTVILIVAFLNWSGFASWIFWVQLYYQNYLQLTPVEAMVRFLPMFVMGLLCNFFVVMVAARLPLVIFIVCSTLITGSACVLFALIDPSTTFWAFAFPSTVMSVFGADFVYTAGTIFVAKIVFPHEQSVAGGLFQTMTQIGTAFGLTISTIVFDAVVDTQSPQSEQLKGYRFAQWTCAAFPYFAALLAVIFLRGAGIVEHRKNAEEDQSEQTVTELHEGAQPPTLNAVTITTWPMTLSDSLGV